MSTFSALGLCLAMLAAAVGIPLAISETKKRKYERRRKAFDELTRISQECGGYDDLRRH